MTRRALLALAVAVTTVAGCQVRTEIGVSVEADGSGVVTVAVGLDAGAVARVGRLEDQLRLDDLVATGWEITGPTEEADGFTWIRASKPFAAAEDAGTVLAEVAGENGPFQGFAVTRDRSFARTTYEFAGRVDLSAGLEQFGDDALAAALDGEPLGEDIAAIEERIGRAIDEAFSIRVAVRLPGGLSSTNAPTRADNGAVWEPRLSEPGVVELRATSEIVRTRTIAYVVAAVLAAVGAIAVAVGFPRRRRRARHAA